MILKPHKNTITIIGMIFFMTVMGCQKDGADESVSDAVITGFDARDCVCCGGLMINFNNDPVPYSGTFCLINDLPAKTSD